MRLNKYIASSSPLSRRAADAAIASGRVTVNGQRAEQGIDIAADDIVTLDGTLLTPRSTHATITFNKPVGYVCSRNGQGARTIYDLLPGRLQHLQPVGRLDKDSSGLLIMTDDGDLANQLTHPRYGKTKVYEVTLDKPLEPFHHQLISDKGVMLDDGSSRFAIAKLEARDMRQEIRTEYTLRNGDKNVALGDAKSTLNSYLIAPNSAAYEVTMREGRNRQIRRTFAALGYTVTSLHRTHFGPYSLADLPSGKIRTVQ